MMINNRKQNIGIVREPLIGPGCRALYKSMNEMYPACNLFQLFVEGWRVVTIRLDEIETVQPHFLVI